MDDTAFNRLGHVPGVEVYPERGEADGRKHRARSVMVPAVDGVPLIEVIAPEDDRRAWVLEFWEPEPGGARYAWGAGGIERPAAAVFGDAEHPGEEFPFDLLPLFLCFCGDENDGYVGMRVEVGDDAVTWSDALWVRPSWEEGHDRDDAWVSDGPASSVRLRFEPAEYRAWLAAERERVMQQRAARANRSEAHGHGRRTPGSRTRRPAKWWWADDGRATPWRALRRWWADERYAWADLEATGWDQGRLERVEDALRAHDPLRLSDFGRVPRWVRDDMVEDVRLVLPWHRFIENPRLLARSLLRGHVGAPGRRRCSEPSRRRIAGPRVARRRRSWTRPRRALAWRARRRAPRRRSRSVAVTHGNTPGNRARTSWPRRSTWQRSRASPWITPP